MQLILYICLTVLSFCQATKFCANCKYYMKTINTFPVLEKCKLFVKPEDPEELRQKDRDHLQYLVSGIKINRPEPPKEYFYCETARTSGYMCGLEGHKFEPISIEPIEPIE